jgi:hypothetical protein
MQSLFVNLEETEIDRYILFFPELHLISPKFWKQYGVTFFHCHRYKVSIRTPSPGPYRNNLSSINLRTADLKRFTEYLKCSMHKIH